MYFDSPYISKQKNSFNVTNLYEKQNSEAVGLKLSCRDDFNRQGGALGNVDCFFEGEYRSKSRPQVQESGQKVAVDE